MAFFFSCRPIAHLVIAAHESVRICVTGPGHQNQFYQWIYTPYFREEISVAFITIYLQQQIRTYGNELWKDKGVFPLESAVEFIFNITKQQKKIQAASPELRQRLLCTKTQPEVLLHLHVARLQRALGTESLPWVQTAYFCGMILPWCFCKDHFCDKLLKALWSLQQNHRVIPSCFMWQWKQILLPLRQHHSFANFPSSLLLNQIKLRY